MKPAVFLAPAHGLAVSAQAFFEDLRGRVAAGARPVTFYGRAGDSAGELVLTAVLEEARRLAVLRTSVERDRGFGALTPAIPAFHMFERELHEEHGIEPHGHPWLKPVRYPASATAGPNAYPFYQVLGKEVHEVAVVPIHAGVIEPGHFRFMCLGEVVHHLEIELGYQHRGAERLLIERELRGLAPLVETIAGDASVAHAWAYCAGIEALCGTRIEAQAELSRAVALELERIAMHLAGLAGLSTDIAFLQGASSYGRLRTTAINTSMLLCGSRFGRGWLRPGGVRARAEGEGFAALLRNLTLLKTDTAIINEHFLSARSVRHRLRGVGVVTREQALELGLVGMTARASGVDLDLRASLPDPLYQRLPVNVVRGEQGDCWDRAVLRLREIDESLRWLEAALADSPGLRASQSPLGQPAPATLAVVLREGWRGEVVHCLETDALGHLRHYKVQDPSLRNWFGLALAVRNNEIADFPICNKSFDLRTRGTTYDDAEEAAMLTTLRVRRSQGRQYIVDLRRAQLSGFRGRPVIGDGPCVQGCRACEQVCPTQAIALDPLRLDLGRCVFCGDCVPVCPPGKLTFTAEHRMATASREALVVREADRTPAPVPVALALRKLFGRSLKLRSVSTGGCNGCELELNALGNVNFDLGRYGIEFVASPRHADALVLSGALTRAMSEALELCYAGMPDPKFVISFGACAISGGLYEGSPALERGFLDRFAPSLYVPGCPPHPLTFVSGILDLLGIDLPGP